MAFKKTELNDFCQTNKIQVDGYETRRVEDGFLSILKCGDNIFESSRPRSTKKEAENEAAVIALNALKVRPRDHHDRQQRHSPSRSLEREDIPIHSAQQHPSSSSNSIDPRSGQTSSPGPSLSRPPVPYTAVPSTTNEGMTNEAHFYVRHLLTQYCQINRLHFMHKVMDLGKGQYKAYVAIGDKIFNDESIHDSFDGAKHHINMLALKELKVEEFLTQYYRSAPIMRGPTVMYPQHPTQTPYYNTLPYVMPTNGGYQPMIRTPLMSQTTTPVMYNQIPPSINYRQQLTNGEIDQNISSKLFSNIGVAKQPSIDTPTTRDNNTTMISRSAVTNSAVLLSPSDFKQSTVKTPSCTTTTTCINTTGNSSPLLVTTHTGTTVSPQKQSSQTYSHNLPTLSCSFPVQSRPPPGLTHPLASHNPSSPTVQSHSHSSTVQSHSHSSTVQSHSSTVQPYSSNTPPTVQSHSHSPTVQSHSHSSTLQPYSSNTPPTVQSHSNTPPTVQPYSSNTPPIVQSHSNTPPTVQPYSSNTPPIVQQLNPNHSTLLSSAMSLPTRSNLRKDKKNITPSPVSSPTNQFSSSTQAPFPTATSTVSNLPTGSTMAPPTLTIPVMSCMASVPSVGGTPNTSEVHSTSPSTDNTEITSYKAILNEYALKNKLLLPVYTTEDPEDCVGYVGVADFGGKRYKSAPDKNKKKAFNLVAYEVLTSLGVVSANKPHPSVTTPTQFTNISFKNQLQEYFQKRKLPLPQYITVQTSNGKFICTVTCDYSSNGGGKKSYKGLESTNKKMAEQTAAEIVCKALKI